MKQIHIIRNGQVTNILPYNTAEEIAHVEKHVVMGSFGKPAHFVKSVISPEIPAVIAEDGSEIVPAVPEVYEMVEVPAEFSTEIVDLTAQGEQARINKEAEEYLASTDWYILRELDSGVPCPEEIRKARQAAREKIVKG